ncbi:hypothetical protein QFC19_008944 [Naganishia cerealis]|uniref:Uncharacterized protein n=1 Tax=Naganishia cerealis TaxID=610337 RepID=A0ACC2UYT2_9TREE|nr:hypothetical protein QFC19_008944 [Naganishia cerealis]
MVLKGNIRKLARYGYVRSRFLRLIRLLTLDFACIRKPWAHSQTARTATSTRRSAHIAAALIPERLPDSVSPDNDSAGPSNYYLSRAEHPQRTFDNVTSASHPSPPDMSPEDSAGCQSLLRLINLPVKNRQQTREAGTSTHSDLVWKTFRELSNETRSTLPLQMLKRVLRSVVPPASTIRKQFQSRIERCDGTEESLTAVTIYPYENRLQAVISAMRRSEKHSMQKEDEKLGLEVEPIPRLNQNLFSINDYVFVLRQFALTGYLTGAEQVVKEIDRLGISVNWKVHEARLAALSKWVTANLDIRRRFWAFQNLSRGDERRFDSLSAVLARTKLPGLDTRGRMPAFFPPDVARLLGDMLYSLRKKDTHEYRSATLDLLLRVAKELERPEALNAILKAGYGINLQFPDVPESEIDVESRVTAKKANGKRAKRGSRVDEDWVDQVTRRTKSEDGLSQDASSGAARTDATSSPMPTFDNAPRSTSNHSEISVRAMNTLVDGLGTSGDVWKMLQVFEVLGNPLHASGSTTRSSVPEWSAASNTLPSSATDAGSVVGKLIRRTGKVTSTSPEHDEDADPPMTLSEALQREESSGARLSFFGLTSSDANANANSPNFFNQAEYNDGVTDTKAIARSAEEFQTPQPTPKAIQTRARDPNRTVTYQTMSDNAIRQVLRELEPAARHRYHSNTTTYQALIRHSSRHAAWKMDEDTVAARAMYSLGSHFVKDAVREMIARHNVLIEQWVQVREWALAQRALVLKQAEAMKRNLEFSDPAEPASTTTTSSNVVEEVSKWLSPRLAAIDSRKTWLRSKIHHPSILVTAEMVTPLLRALRAGKRLDTERERTVKSVMQDVQRVIDYLKEEWEVLTGRSWTPENHSAVRPTSTPTLSAATDTLPSPRDHDETMATLPSELAPKTIEYDRIHIGIDHRDAVHTFQLSKHLSMLRRDLTGLERLLEDQAKRMEVDKVVFDDGTTSGKA